MSSDIAITKELSKNDTGETGAHQAGMHIPKEEDILAFFPTLTKKIKNPRQEISVVDMGGQRWKFTFIYYNNRFFGGTRNEYRLTGMTRFLRSSNLKAGDQIILSLKNGSYRISYNKKSVSDEGVLKLGTTWKIIPV